MLAAGTVLFVALVVVAIVVGVGDLVHARRTRPRAPVSAQDLRDLRHVRRDDFIAWDAEDDLP